MVSVGVEQISPGEQDGKRKVRIGLKNSKASKFKD